MTETVASPERQAESTPTRGSTAAGGAILWIGTLFYGGSTVALLSILSRHLGHSSFSSLSALVSLAFVVGLIPAGLQLRSASLVADGRPPPRMTRRQTATTAAVALAISPLFAFLLHVPELSSALICLQMLIAIPLALKQGAFLGLRQFRTLGVNLLIEGLARLLMGAVAGSAWGLTGLSAGLVAGTATALIALPSPGSLGDKHDRPRTSLIGTSLALALLGLYVQVDVLIAPSVLTRAGSSTYDLAAVPSKAIYVVLLAATPLVFPFVRRRQVGTRLLVAMTLVSIAVGLLCSVLVAALLPLVGLILGRPRAGLLEFGLLALAMTFAGTSGVIITASIARGVKRPWTPPAIGIATLLLSWPFRPNVLTYAAVVAASQAATTILSFGVCLWGKRGESPTNDPLAETESLAEAGDPLATVQGMHDLSEAASGSDDAVDELPEAASGSHDTVDTQEDALLPVPSMILETIYSTKPSKSGIYHVLRKCPDALAIKKKYRVLGAPPPVECRRPCPVCLDLINIWLNSLPPDQRPSWFA